MRIRLPGGLIEAAQLQAVAGLASRFADGTVEITSRANLQLRAIQLQDLSQVAAEITAAGMLPSPEHDRVRNIVTSPLAGLDADELLDTRPLVRELDRRLRAESLFAELHPKFSFGLQGGWRRFSQDGDDLALEACGGSSLRLSVHGLPTSCCVPQTHAVDCLLQAARLCIELANKAGVPVRAKRIFAEPGVMTGLEEDLFGLTTPASAHVRPPVFVEALPGVLPSGQDGLVNIIPSVPLGRLSAQQAGSLAEIARQWRGDLRLAPWRGVVLGSVDAMAAIEVIDQLAATGLACDGRDGFHGLAACAGSAGCDASLADVRADAALLARRLSRGEPLTGWSVNLSGCEKQCARRHGASAELIGNGAGYLLKIDGQVIASSCSAEFAVNAITSLHAQRLSEVAAR